MRIDVGFSGNDERLVRTLEKRLEKQGVSCGSSPEAGYISVTAGLTELSSALASFLYADYYPRLIISALNREYDFIPKKERSGVFRRALSLVRLPGSKEGLTAEAADTLFLCLLENRGLLPLDGVVRFRLRGHLEELRNAMEDAVEEYLDVSGEQEFVELLRCFVEMRSPQRETIHIAVDKKGCFRLRDENGERISTAMPGAEYTPDTTPEDMLMSRLITIAPEEIVFDTAIDPELKRLIESVFIGRTRAEKR